jgi:hypothetical protein
VQLLLSFTKFFKINLEEVKKISMQNMDFLKINLPQNSVTTSALTAVSD